MKIIQFNPIIVNGINVFPFVTDNTVFVKRENDRNRTSDYVLKNRLECYVRIKRDNKYYNILVTSFSDINIKDPSDINNILSLKKDFYNGFISQCLITKHFYLIGEIKYDYPILIKDDYHQSNDELELLNAKYYEK